MPDRDFEDHVKRIKAAEWLLQNDPFVRRFDCLSQVSAAYGVLAAAEYGDVLRQRIDDVAPRMEVTDEDRRLGYPGSNEGSVSPEEVARRLGIYEFGLEKEL